MPLPLSAGEPREPGKALSKTSLAPKRRARSAACLTASSAVADPSIPTATVEIIRAQYPPNPPLRALDVRGFDQLAEPRRASAVVAGRSRKPLTRAVEAPGRAHRAPSARPRRSSCDP